MDRILIFIVVILVGYRTIAFAQKIKFAWKLKERNKPSKATECHFCKIDTTDAKVVRRIECKHPLGKDLTQIENPLNCVFDCDYGFEYFENLKTSDAMVIERFEKILLNEIIALTTMLIPGLIALYKLAGG